MSDLKGKFAYIAPRLTVYGDFAQLTAAGSGLSMEMPSNNTLTNPNRTKP